ncbi:MAG: hypothetical protein DRJ63_01865 [Thermoprotei archaeon]|nr:MAG: hypothetical protein DRJ63_01865 [Thermoprotei archaeon]
MRKLLAIIFTVLYLSVFLNQLLITVKCSNMEVSVRKSIEYYCILSLNGEIEEWKVDIEIIVDGVGRATVVDRMWYISPETLLEAEPKPSTILFYGKYSKLIWRDIKIPTVIKYSARLFSAPPLKYSIEVRVNGEKANITQRSGVNYIKADVGDLISVNITLVNSKGKWLCEGEEIVVPLNLIVMFSLPSYLGLLSLTPESNVSLTIGDGKTDVWMLTLYDKVTICFKARVTGTNPWGEVPLKSITVQVVDRPDVVSKKAEEMLSKLEENIESLKYITRKLEQGINASKTLAKGLMNVSSLLNYTGYSLVSIAGALKTSGEKLIEASKEMSKLLSSFESAISEASSIVSTLDSTVESLKSGEVNYEQLTQMIDQLIELLEATGQNQSLIDTLVKLKNLLIELEAHQEELVKELEYISGLVKSLSNALKEGKEASEELEKAGQMFTKLAESVEKIGFTNINVSKGLYNISQNLFSAVNSSIKQLDSLKEKLSELENTESRLRRLKKCADAEWNLYYKYSLEVALSEVTETPEIKIIQTGKVVRDIRAETPYVVYGVLVRDTTNIKPVIASSEDIIKDASVHMLNKSVLICPLSNGSILKTALGTPLELINATSPKVELDTCAFPANISFSVAFTLELILPRILSLKKFTPEIIGEKRPSPQRKISSELLVLTTAILCTAILSAVKLLKKRRKKIEVDITDIINEIEKIRREIAARTTSSDQTS